MSTQLGIQIYISWVSIFLFLSLIAAIMIGFLPQDNEIGFNYIAPESRRFLSVCFEIVSGSLAPGTQAAVQFLTLDDSAKGECD